MIHNFLIAVTLAVALSSTAAAAQAGAVAVTAGNMAAAIEADVPGASSELGQLDDFVTGVESILPESWRVVEADTSRVPIGWSGPPSGLYVMVEDTRTRFFHPNGFHYYSFYRIWLMPPDWEGEMRQTPYVADSAPAFLLGLNDDHVALYHTAGGNVWSQGPAELCSALGLNAIRYSDLTRRVVDMAMEERLTTGVQQGSSFQMNPYRIVGLSGEGTGLYLEYVFSNDEDPDSDHLEYLTERLAGDVFEKFPEVESLYLRRCTSDTFTDTIVNRD